MQSVKPVDDMTPAEAAALNAQLAAVRTQILEAQRTNAGRDEKALETEREWYRQNSGKK